MMEDIKIGVVGGDKRQLSAAKELAAAGADISCYGTYKDNDLPYACSLEECVEGSAAVILGVPYSNDNKWINCATELCAISVNSLLNKMSPGQLLLGGRMNSYIRDAAQARKIRTADYFEGEDLNILNAVPTAEGALCLAMQKLEITLHGANALVLGFGRIGKLLCEYLKALGAKVCVAARKDADKALAQVKGYDFCNIYDLSGAARGADVIFNTVPHIVLTEEALCAVKADALIIDLASKPGGVDQDCANKLGKRVIWALSLPGKVAPVSAGRILSQSMIRILREEGILS